jgi:predicted nucleotidyltransferase
MDINLNQDELTKLSALGIKALILFGSQSQGLANEKSDYDFFIIGPKTNETYDFIYDMLSPKIKKLTNIDIVFEVDAPMELKYHVIKYGKIIYEKDENVFLDFKEKIMTIYQDFAPHRKMFQQATFERIT